MTAYEEKELLKFTTNPTYREKIIAKIHKERDALYHKNVKNLELEVSTLTRARTTEITRIANARWENVLSGKLAINPTEGKVKINQAEVLFSSIKGAELNVQQGTRIVTTDNSKSKKSASLGGAVVGGLVGGPLGIVVGGVGMGKTKTTGTSVSNQIPTCSHIGVLVNIDGFVSEISLLNTQVDQSSSAFQQAYQMAQKLVSRLAVLAQTPMPSGYLLPEQEPSVQQIETQIPIKKNELEVAVAKKPTYELPETYRSAEQGAMSDEAYLAYLKQNDVLRQEQILQDKELLKQQKAQLKELERQERAERRASRTHVDGMRVLSILADIVFWICSLFVLLGAVVYFSNVYILGGIVLLFTALLINPLVYRLIQRRFFPMKRWMCIVIFVVGFVVGVIIQ